jgi:uncharacterized membrane protein YhaH (DUF805 family)
VKSAGQGQISALRSVTSQAYAHSLPTSRGARWSRQLGEIAETGVTDCQCVKSTAFTKARLTANSSEPEPGEWPLSDPYDGATFRIALDRFWKKYATFTGRATKSEYWWAVLFIAITGAVVNVIDAAGLISMNLSSANATQPFAPSPLFVIGAILVGLWGLALIVPIYAVTVRRLHDTNRSGWFILMGFIPYAGPIILLVFTLRNSNPLGQRFDTTARV